ncbi:MAG: M20/M25/M40 family metallo-hydrolase [Candidatus Izemoplasmatales bacterium]|jgi:carboxypeptidase PM20D1|nr:M20/M25/M40 family metallo-hydrolase [Candidatus Izemoplasmatales bacterium]MDD4987785.1 M20/M25/M40 family metallo-hydrolase [Candidatus Izemoplasmatales bacterium]
MVDVILYSLLGIIGLFILLLLIAVIRALWMRVPPLPESLYVSDPQKEEAYGLGLQKLIRHQTIAGFSDAAEENFRAMQQTMESLFPLVHQQLKKTVFPGGSMIFHWKGKNPGDPLVLMAHQDVVPADKAGWHYDPFEGTIENGEIFGRGTFDTKSTLFAFFQATEDLLATGFTPNNDVYLASSSDEEISGTGAKKTVDWLKEQHIRPALVLDEGGAIVTGALPTAKQAVALIGILEKGYVNIQFTAKSDGGHSSTPPRHTPIARLAEFIHHVESRFPLKTKMIPEVADLFKTVAPSMAFLYRLLFGNMWLFKGLVTWLLPKINPYGRALFSSTIAFTMMKGSEAANVIPAEASVLANIRTHPIQGIESTHLVLSKIAKRYGISAQILEGREATPMVSTKSDSYRYLVSIIQKTFPDVLVSPYVVLGGTDARFYTEISDSALRFSPIRVHNRDLKKMHGIDESLRLDALAEAVIFYREIIGGFQS